MKKKLFYEITLLTGFLLVVGCATIPERDAKEVAALPSAYGDTSWNQKGLDLPTQNKWWLRLESDSLNQLMDQVFAANLDMQTAWARLRQSEAIYGGSRAALFPSLSGTLSETESRRNIGQGNSFSASEYSGALTVSYELDVWGKVRAGTKVAEAQLSASAYDVEATAWTISATVARTWIDLQKAVIQLDLLNDQLENNEKQYELIETRYAHGSSTALDLAQQKKTLASVRALLPPQQKQVELLRQQLAILAGLPADSDLDLSFQDQFSMNYLDLSTGVPSDLLSRRPDLRSAELNLKAADWNVVQAKAARWPSLTISGNANVSSEDIVDLFDTWGASFISNLVAPLYDAGGRKAEVERKLAAAEIELLNYRSQVLNAHQEVVESIASIEYDKATLKAQAMKLEAAKSAYRESDFRYLNGSTNYLNVITSLNDYQSSQRDYVAAQADVWKDTINLMVALGGPIETTGTQLN